MRKILVSLVVLVPVLLASANSFLSQSLFVPLSESGQTFTEIVISENGDTGHQTDIKVQYHSNRGMIEVSITSTAPLAEGWLCDIFLTRGGDAIEAFQVQVVGGLAIIDPLEVF